MQPHMPLYQSMISVTGLLQSSVRHVHTQGGIYPQSGRVNPGIERIFLSHFMVQQSMTIHRRWLYGLFVAIDANFRLKLKTRGIKDPELGSGLSYFVNTTKFEAHLKGHVDKDKVSISNLFCRTEYSRPKRSRLVGQSSMR